MKEIIIASKIISDVVDNHVLFSLSLNKNFKNEKLALQDKNIISSLAASSMRHYCLLDAFVNKEYPEISKTVRYPLFVYIVNFLFVHKIDEGKAQKYVKGLLADKKDINFDKLDEKLKAHEDLVPPEFEKGSIDYLRIRYNTPDFIIRMWKKHFGENRTYAILRANMHTPKNFYRLKDKSFKEELLKDSSSFKDTEFKEYVVKEEKEKNIPSQLIRMNPAFECIFNDSEIDPLRGLVIYSSSSLNPLIEQMYLRFSNNASYEIITDNPKTYFPTKKLLEEYGLSKINLYEAKPQEAITILSQPSHTIIVVPENSELDLLRKYPDCYFRLSSNKIDESLIRQKETLTSFAPFVEEGGELIYIVPTLNDKEGRRQIASFLSEYPDFVLTKQKQFFPFDKYSTSLFYAILRKVKKDD